MGPPSYYLIIVELSAYACDFRGEERSYRRCGRQDSLFNRIDGRLRNHNIGLRTSQIRILLNTLFAAANLAQSQGATNALDLTNTLDLSGISAFRPTEFELGQVELPEETLALIRLKREGLPVFDLVLDFGSTEQLGAALVEFAQTGPLKNAPYQ